MIRKIFQSPEGLGLLFLLILCAALLIANSPLYPAYQNFISLPLQIGWDTFHLRKPTLLWINDGLMAIFFLSLALEIKTEAISGDLSTPTKALLPCVGALGGIVVPALIYFGLTQHNALLQAGWPIPTTTDVPLSLAAASALGRRVPTSLKTFLLAFSIVDDVAAIAIIAMAYTSKLSLFSMVLALSGIIALLLFNLFKVRNLACYLLAGGFIWVCVLESGIHATLAGVVVGFLIPAAKKEKSSPLAELSKALHPWINYFILPIFIFFNSGLHFDNFDFTGIFSPLSLGIILGLWLGKMIGIFLAAYLLIKFKITPKLHEATNLQLLGIAALGGIGFTMSFFLSALAFEARDLQILSRQAILIGSLLSLITGVLIFLLASQSIMKRGAAQHNPAHRP